MELSCKMVISKIRSLSYRLGKCPQCVIDIEWGRTQREIVQITCQSEWMGCQPTAETENNGIFVARVTEHWTRCLFNVSKSPWNADTRLLKPTDPHERVYLNV